MTAGDNVPFPKLSGENMSSFYYFSLHLLIHNVRVKYFTIRDEKRKEFIQ